MPDLLFLSDRIPCPRHTSGKARAWHMLKHLAGRYRVQLGCLLDELDDRRWIGELKQVCDEVHVAEGESGSRRGRGLAGMLTRLAPNRDAVEDAGLAGWISTVVATKSPTHAFAVSSPMAAFVPGGTSPLRRRVVDMVDVASDRWRQHAARKPWPLSMQYSREARRMLAYERTIAGRFDACLFVSEHAAALFRRLAPESAGRIDHVSDGVDCVYFSPEREYPNPLPNDRKAIVFTGAMDYGPNADAVCWFVREVLPLLKARGVQASFWIVGSNPAPDVRRLAAPDVIIAGEVEDIRPYIAHAALVVAPLRARGVQSQVLEGMAMAKAVVATPEALDGVQVEPGREAAVAGDARGFALAVVAALSGRGAAAMGARARQRVVEACGWTHSLARLDAALDG